jgi:predicted metal-dependent hydrolase
MSESEVRIIRSPRRVRTVSIRAKDGYLEVLAPHSISDEELEPIIARLRRRIEKRRVAGALTGKDLEARAQTLNERHFGGKLRWNSIDWVTNQEHRWGSCTPALGTIRLSHRLAELPLWVLDYVIVHELVHLLEPSHNARFWRLVKPYPLAERARGYLLAIAGELREADM